MTEYVEKKKPNSPSKKQPKAKDPQRSQSMSYKPKKSLRKKNSITTLTKIYVPKSARNSTSEGLTFGDSDLGQSVQENAASTNMISDGGSTSPHYQENFSFLPEGSGTVNEELTGNLKMGMLVQAIQQESNASTQRNVLVSSRPELNDPILEEDAKDPENREDDELEAQINETEYNKRMTAPANMNRGNLELGEEALEGEHQKGKEDGIKQEENNHKKEEETTHTTEAPESNREGQVSNQEAATKQEDTDNGGREQVNIDAEQQNGVVEDVQESKPSNDVHEERVEKTVEQESEVNKEQSRVDTGDQEANKKEDEDEGEGEGEGEEVTETVEISTKSKKVEAPKNSAFRKGIRDDLEIRMEDNHQESTGADDAEQKRKEEFKAKLFEVEQKRAAEKERDGQNDAKADKGRGACFGLGDSCNIF